MRAAGAAAIPSAIPGAVRTGTEVRAETWETAALSESSSEYVGEITGVFYTMEEAYEAGYLTREDLTNIAYYHNEWVPYPETLDNSIAEAIKKTQAEDLRKDVPEAKAEDIQIIKILWRI